MDRAPPPARATLKRVTAERVALYSRVPPQGDNIPVTIEPFAVEDGVPEEEKIEWAVKRLQNNRPGGPSSTMKGSIMTRILSPGGGYPSV